MKDVKSFTLLFFFYHTILVSQVNLIDFPETCDFITVNSLGVAYLGTTTGLFYFTGTGSAERIDLSGLDNLNVQSSFFEDQKGHLWFCTYNRIVSLNPVDRSYKSYPLIDANGDTLHSDYYVFDIDHTNNELLVKQGNNIFKFNTKTFRASKLCDGIGGRRFLKTESKDRLKVFLSYYYTLSPKILFIDQENNKCQSVLTWKNWPANVMANDMIVVDTLRVLIATSKGLFIGDLSTFKVTPLDDIFLKDNVQVIGSHSADSWIIYGETFGMKSLQWKNLSFELAEAAIEGIQHPIDQIVTSDDGTVFLSSFDNSIYFKNPRQPKFQNFDSSIIFPFTRLEDLNRKINQYTRNVELSSNGIPYMFNEDVDLLSPPPYSKSILRSMKGEVEIPHPEGSTLYRYFVNGPDIFGSFINKAIYRLDGQAWEEVKYPSGMSRNCNYYHPINDSISMVSVNQEKIILWNTNTAQIIKELVFSGDIHNEMQDETGNIFFSAEQGILSLDKDGNELKLMVKTPSPCYCLLMDSKNQFWFSSKNEIYNYNPSNESFRKISSWDSSGLRKYAERKCIALSPDSLLFYYENGITLVIPSMATASTTESHVYLTDLKINDLDYFASDTLSYSSTFVLPYINNTLSFEVQSIDWSDPENADLRYRLEGYDDIWIPAGSRETFIRYAKLPPGHYRLLIQARNAVGVWNKSLKEIAITIKPPFWMTWWFISFVVLASIGIIYTVFRSYYQRKLEKKNIALREQAQVIKHQQELEHERTRIAGEMHDDLGSGLTTIRYLSDKALIHAKDATETEQIQRIAEHSNRLVRNMSEIIWAMNSRFDNAENLVGYLRRYASEFLSEHQFPLAFISNDDSQQIIHVGGEKRRNIFLVFKEMLHNAVKYSGASKIEIDVNSDDDIKITIREIGGKGFDAASSSESGNGLYNAHKRMDTIGGKLSFLKSDDAMVITISAPIDKSAHA